MSDGGAPPRGTVLVTGSSGLIGRRVVEDLARDGAVLGLDVAKPDALPVGATWLECDLTDDASVRRAFDEARERSGGVLASAVHLAAYYDFSGAPSPLYRTLTVEGTRRLLRELREFDRVERLVFSSSLLVMRPAPEGTLLHEDDPVQAEWDYPRSKLEAERVIAEERGPVPAVVLRLAGAYDADCHSIPLAQQLRRIHEKTLESFFFPGNPHHAQSFVHLDDAVAAVRRAVERRHRLGGHELLLVGEPDAPSYGELQDRMGVALHGREWPTLRIPAPVAKAGAWLRDKLPGGDPFIEPWMVDQADANYPVSIDRARDRLGWEPRHRLVGTLGEMVERLRRDPEGWYRRNGLAPPGARNEGRA